MRLETGHFFGCKSARKPRLARQENFFRRLQSDSSTVVQLQFSSI